MLWETFSNFSQQLKQNHSLTRPNNQISICQVHLNNWKIIQTSKSTTQSQPKQAKHFYTAQKQKEIQATKLTCLSPTGIFTEYGCSAPPSPTTDSDTSGELADALTAERRLILPERSERKLHLREVASRGEGGNKSELERRKWGDCEWRCSVARPWRELLGHASIVLLFFRC